MEKKAKKLDYKIQQITVVYKELTKSEFYIVKKNLIDTLRKLCAQGLNIIENENVSPENLRRRKQIEDMLKRTLDIEKKIDQQEKNNPSIGSQNKNPRQAFDKTNQIYKESKDEQKYEGKEPMDPEILRQKSVQVARSMIFHQLTSQNINATSAELDQLAVRIQKNYEVMKEMEMMVIEQGGNIDKVEEEIMKTYENVVEANIELDEAKKIQTKNRILKLRMGISGFLGAIGLKILGLPGLIFGFFGGMIATQ